MPVAWMSEDFDAPIHAINLYIELRNVTECLM